MRPEVLVFLGHEGINHGAGNLVVGHVAAVLIVDTADFLAVAVEDDAGVVEVVDILQVELLCPLLVLGRDRGEECIADEAERDSGHTEHDAETEQETLPPAAGCAVFGRLFHRLFLSSTLLAAALCRSLTTVLVLIEILHSCDA